MTASTKLVPGTDRILALLKQLIGAPTDTATGSPTPSFHVHVVQASKNTRGETVLAFFSSVGWDGKARAAAPKPTKSPAASKRPSASGYTGITLGIEAAGWLPIKSFFASVGWNGTPVAILAGPVVGSFDKELEHSSANSVHQSLSDNQISAQTLFGDMKWD